MRINSVSFANYTGIKTNNRQNVNNNKYAGDTFIKSQPTFNGWRYNGHIDDLRELVSIKETFLNPIIKHREADWNHLSKIVEINDKNELSMSLEGAKLASLLRNPKGESGFQIFSLVDKKLEKFDEYVKNIMKYEGFKNQPGNTDDNILEMIYTHKKLFNTEPEIIKELKPLAVARKKVERDIENGLKNVKVPHVDEPRKAVEVSFLIAQNSYPEASRLADEINIRIQALDETKPLTIDVKDVLYKKLKRILKADEQYRKRLEIIARPVQDIKSAEYDLDGYSRKVGKLSVQAKKTISHGAVELDKTFRKKFNFMPETSPELDKLLVKQKAAIGEIQDMFDYRNREIADIFSEKMKNLGVRTDDYGDLPF